MPRCADVIDLHDPCGADPLVSGGKAATLAALTAQDLPVPPGFVVTTAACARIVETVDGAAGDVSAARVPDDLRAAIALALEHLGDGTMAVRSSGIAEDLVDASYAGQYETVLGVRGLDEVLGAVLTCLASARSERVRVYSGSAVAPMAVLVQHMVPADAAGVAFTANPVTGDDEILVSSVRGTGDRLVSGEATPDEWVARDGELRCLRSTEGSLETDRARDIVELARRVAEFADAPQDLEWAIAGDELYLLQARPITALPRAPRIEPPGDGFWRKDTTHYPTPLTPFGASVYLPAVDRGSAEFARFGFLFDGFEQQSLGGEVYTHARPVGGKDRSPPPSWVMWIAARLVPALRRRNRAAEQAIASDLSTQFIERWEDEWRDTFREEAERLKRVDLRALTDRELLAQLDMRKAFLERGQIVHFRLSAAYALPLYDLFVTCEDLLGWDRAESLALVSGSSEASAEAGRAMRALASRIESDADALQVLQEPGDDVLARLQESSPTTGAAFLEYLDRYGHRTAGYDPGDPTLFERPAMLAALVRDRIGENGHRHDATQVAGEALARARAVLTGSRRDLERFERALGAARRVYGNREDNIFWVDNQPCAFLRYAAVEIGRRLEARGVLARDTDAVFLEERELRDALAGEAAGDLCALVARRKAERAWVMAHPGPASYGVDPGPPPDLDSLPSALRLVNTAALEVMQLLFPTEEIESTRTQLRGAPGSPGRYTGHVRVLRAESDFAKLRPGDILVCPITTPAWSVLFLQAGAVVTDGGGVLSHTAVIAREYAIPAVLATGLATQRLHDGELVTVDGTAGVVTMNEVG